MGVDRTGRRPRPSGSGSLRALVVPDVPTFAVDDGFRYRIPDGLPVAVGSVVRIPLGNRVVRGWVTAIDDDAGGGLKEIRKVSGDFPVFDGGLLQTLRWASRHYVAPLPVLLARATPPNLPRRRSALNLGTVPIRQGPIAEVGAAAAGRRSRSGYVLTRRAAFGASVADLVGPVVGAGRSALIVAPTAVEAKRLAAELAEIYGAPRVVTVLPADSDATVTGAWSRLADTSGLVAVGTERLMFWRVAALALGVLVDEGRRGMKSRQTPTVHVRDVMLRRGAVERFTVQLVGDVPTTEALAAGVVVQRRDAGRLWSLVEVADRGEEPPGPGVVSDRARIALRAATRAGTRSFVFTHRHGYAPAFRCLRCRSLRTCPACGTGATGSSLCRRCGADLGPCPACNGRRFEPLGAAEGRVVDELRRAIGADLVGSPGEARPITVGTARDLPELTPVGLAVAVDADALVFGTNYRSAEEALRVLARLAGAVEAGSGHRLLLQTARPSHPVYAGLRRGDPITWLRREIESRGGLGMPPVGELIVVEVRDAPGWSHERLVEAAAESRLLGPVDTPRGRRWMIQGADLSGVRTGLRAVVGDLREGGATVRVDVDPLDL